MNPEEITLSNLSKSFEYTKIANKIDDCSSLDDLKTWRNVLQNYISSNKRQF